MFKEFIKYIVSFIFLLFLSIILLDYIILPTYVGYDNEHYLPDVRGMYIEKATYKLHSIGFMTDNIVIPFSIKHTPGTVVKMFPRAFTKVKEGRTINLTIAGKDKDINIPNMKNMTLRNAKIILNRLTLGIDTIIYEYHNSIEEGLITFHLPKKDESVKSSDNIILGVSKGNPPDYYIIPDILNLSLKRAKDKILINGLRVGQVSYEYQPDLLPNTVIEQSMTAGMRVSFPATINLIISSIKE